jgi:hypothetical protein
MEYRTIKNALAGTGIIASILALIIPKLISAFGAVEIATSINETMELVKKSDWQINWDGIYVLVLIFSFLFFIGVNIDLFNRWIIKRQQAQIRNWNVTAVDAINWIANSTHESKSLDYNKRYILSVAAFRERALSGELIVSGIKEGSFIHRRIPLKDWKKLKLGYGCVSGNRHVGNEGQVNNVALETPRENGEAKTVWSALMVDRSELKRKWSGVAQSIY